MLRITRLPLTASYSFTRLGLTAAYSYNHSSDNYKLATEAVKKLGYRAKNGRTAIQNFQIARGLDGDDKPGGDTWNKIKIAMGGKLPKPSRPTAANAISTPGVGGAYLSSLGFTGPNAVRNFQNKFNKSVGFNRVKVDNALGQQTFDALQKVMRGDVSLDKPYYEAPKPPTKRSGWGGPDSLRGQRTGPPKPPPMGGASLKQMLGWF